MGKKSMVQGADSDAVAKQNNTAADLAQSSGLSEQIEDVLGEFEANMIENDDFPNLIDGISENLGYVGYLPTTIAELDILIQRVVDNPDLRTLLNAFKAADGSIADISTIENNLKSLKTRYIAVPTHTDATATPPSPIKNPAAVAPQPDPSQGNVQPAAAQPDAVTPALKVPIVTATEPAPAPPVKTPAAADLQAQQNTPPDGALLFQAEAFAAVTQSVEQQREGADRLADPSEQGDQNSRRILPAAQKAQDQPPLRSLKAPVNLSDHDTVPAMGAGLNDKQFAAVIRNTEKELKAILSKPESLGKDNFTITSKKSGLIEIKDAPGGVPLFSVQVGRDGSKNVDFNTSNPNQDALLKSIDAAIQSAVDSGSPIVVDFKDEHLNKYAHNKARELAPEGFSIDYSPAVKAMRSQAEAQPKPDDKRSRPEL